MKKNEMQNRINAGIQLVTFRLGTECYGVPVWKVREIIRPIEASPVPGMIKPMEGVINLRGGIVPVLGIHTLLGVDQRDTEEAPRKQRIVIFDKDSGGFGFFVDEVMEVVRVLSQDIQPPPNVGSDIACPEAILGIVQVSDQMVLCIDPQKLVSGYSNVGDATLSAM
jgi:purine-binding chemotaxis protein CheW